MLLLIFGAINNIVRAVIVDKMYPEYRAYDLFYKEINT